MTAREVEVLGLIAAGYTNREIADTLIISVPTVERHIANIYNKIGARNRADATAYALAHGFSRASSWGIAKTLYIVSLTPSSPLFQQDTRLPGWKEPCFLIDSS